MCNEHIQNVQLKSTSRDKFYFNKVKLLTKRENQDKPWDSTLRLICCMRHAKRDLYTSSTVLTANDLSFNKLTHIQEIQHIYGAGFNLNVMLLRF